MLEASSPVRPGDFIEFFAEIDLLGALLTCPGGDCGASHSSDTAACYPLKVQVFRPEAAVMVGWSEPERNPFAAGHGVGRGWGRRSPCERPV